MRARRGWVGGAVLGALLCAAFGAAEPTVQIKVEERNCLIRICEKYLENPAQWKKIAAANNLKNPNLIRPGQIIVIPASYLKGVPAAGTVVFVKGDVSCASSEGGEWRPLPLKTRVGEGSLVRTGKESGAEIRFDDGNSFLLREETTIGLSMARRSGDSHSKYRISLRNGKLVSDIQNSEERTSAVQVETPAAIAGVRGTVFRSSVGPDGKARFEVLEGTVTVEGGKTVVEVRKGEGTSVVPGGVPASPRKLAAAPAPVGLQPLYRKLPLRLSFGAVEGAVARRIVLARDREMKDTVVEKTLGPGDLFEAAVPADGLYFLQSSSIDGDGLEGVPSAVAEVRVRVNPAPPFVEVPVDKAAYKARSLTCRWFAVAGAASYRVQIAPDADFRRPTADRPGVTGVEFATGDLDYGTYRFRVRSVAADGFESEWSDTLSFAFLPPPPAPVAQAPTIGGAEVHARWQDLGPGVRYRFQMSADRAFAPAAVDRVVEKPEAVFPRPKGAGTYYVRSSGIDSAGREGAFSQPQSFEVRPPPAPALEAPVVVKKDVRAAWQDLGPGVTYRFQTAAAPGFGTVLVDRSVEKPETVFEAPAPKGVWYVRVRGVDEGGVAGPFSEALSFEVTPERRPLPWVVGGAAAAALLLLGL